MEVVTQRTWYYRCQANVSEDHEKETWVFAFRVDFSVCTATFSGCTHKILS